MSTTVYVVAASRFSFWANANYTRWPLRSYSGLGVAAACPLPFPVLRGGAGCRRAQQGAGAIAGCDLYDALRPKTTEAINLRMMKDGFASMTQEQLDELATSGKHIFFHGLVPPSGLVYVPAGYVIAEACVSGSLVHGIRVGVFHCHAVAVQCLRRLADRCLQPARGTAASSSHFAEGGRRLHGEEARRASSRGPGGLGKPGHRGQGRWSRPCKLGCLVVGLGRAIGLTRHASRRQEGEGG